MFTRRVPFILLIVLVAVGLGLLRPNQAAAHATIQNTAPGDGATVEQAPHQVRIWFDQPVVDHLSRLELLDLNGKHWAVSNLHSELDASRPVTRGAGGLQTALIAELPNLPTGAYRVVWQTRSADDLHVINGTVIFGIGQSVTGLAKPQTPTPSLFEVALRWLIFIGFNTLLGTLLVRGLVLPARRAVLDQAGFAGVLRRLERLMGLAALVTLAAWVGVLLLLGADDGSWGEILTRTDYGLRMIAAELLLAALLLSLFVVKKPWRNQTQYGLGASLLIVQALNSHYPVFTPLDFGMDALHLLGASFWAGGLLALAVGLLPMLKSSGELSRLILGRFGKWAGLSLLALTVSGLYKSGQQVASLDGLLTTTYGQVLLAKFDFVLYAAALGLLNTAILHPAVARRVARLLRRPANWQPVAARHLGRLVLVEVVSLAVIVALAAFLTSSSPARGPEFEPPTAENTAVPTVSANTDDLVLTLSVKPNRPGQNFISLSVYNTRRPAPAPIGKVQVRLQPPDGRGEALTLEAEPLGQGLYQIAGKYIQTYGDWEMTLLVTRPGLPDTSQKFPWRVLAADGVTVRPVVFSNAPLTPWLNLAALLVTAIGIAALGWRYFKALAFKPKPTLHFGLSTQSSQEE